MEQVGTAVDGVEVVGALSPSRASDFTRCALAFRFRTVDKLREPPTLQQVRGTLVHRVLEELFDLPAPDRTLHEAGTRVTPAWVAMVEQQPELVELFDAEDAPELSDWLLSCLDGIETWFDLEDPTRLEPAEREVYVENVLDSRLLLRGYVDRVDIAPGGEVRIVDYKTGNAPGVGFEASALFQLKVYALVWWRTHGVLPSVLQLVYLGSGEIIRYSPDAADLEATARKTEAIWTAIREARETSTWLPKPGRVCDWCSYHALCPAQGGTPPPLPEPEHDEDQPQVLDRA